MTDFARRAIILEAIYHLEQEVPDIDEDVAVLRNLLEHSHSENWSMEESEADAETETTSG